MYIYLAVTADTQSAKIVISETCSKIYTATRTIEKIQQTIEILLTKLYSHYFFYNDVINGKSF